MPRFMLDTDTCSYIMKRSHPLVILSRHPQHERSDFRVHARPAQAPPSRRPLLCNQLAMPSEDRVRRHYGRHLTQGCPSELVSDDREAPPLPIRETEAFAVELRLQGTILFPKKSNDVALLLLKPTEERGQHQMKRDHRSRIYTTPRVDSVSRHYEVRVLNTCLYLGFRADQADREEARIS
jgi:hypothetical protein